MTGTAASPARARSRPGAPAAAVSRQHAWLAQVKARYDPGRLFRFPLAIG